MSNNIGSLQDISIDKYGQNYYENKKEGKKQWKLHLFKQICWIITRFLLL